MNSETFCNYFEDYNLNNNIIFLICISIFGLITIINIYFIITYFYKKYCKNQTPLYIESKDPLTNRIYVITEPFV